jgi:acyl carrier protein
MNIFSKIQEILTDILDIEPEDVAEDTYIIRDLGAESIDLLELAVSLDTAFKSDLTSDIVDDDLFLRFLREYIIEADQAEKNRADYIREKYPFLTTVRILEILSDLDDGPVLKVSDVVGYISWLSKAA